MNANPQASRDADPFEMAPFEAAPFDQAKAEAFMERMADSINRAAVTVMISIGHKTGLLDLMAGMPPATSAAIAEAGGLAERYVREWLAAMVTGGVVEYQPADGTYRLPAEHAASLTRGAALGNLAVYAQFVPMVGAVEPRLLECFRSGAGIPYDAYPCFHAFMAEDSGQTVVAQMFDTVLPLAPGLEQRLEAGIDVLDSGCGSGRALLALAERFPASRFTGYDLCADAVENGNAGARERGLANVRFAVKDMTGFAERARYDLILSFDAVHDQKDPQALLTSLAGGLRAGGTFLMQDIAGSAYLENNLDMPMAAFLYTASCTHCTPVSLAQGGKGLGTMWGVETAEAMLGEAGFARVDKTVLEHDPMNVWFVCAKA